MEREHATREPDATDTESELQTADTGTQETTSTATASTATIAATGGVPEAGDTEGLPNTLTIIGQGEPSSFELTVDGELDLLEECESGTTTVSGSTIEGTIETGTIRFRFAGDLTDVTFVDSKITGLSPAVAPNVHVDYADPGRSGS